MSTMPAVIPDASQLPAAPVAPHKPAFIRLIDKLGSFFHAHGGELAQCAEAAEPFVAALTPFGPEYDLAVTAVVGMSRMGAAAQAAGLQMSGPDRMKGAFAIASSALASILTARGVVTQDQDAIILKYLQSVYDLHTLPAVPATATKP